MATFDRGPLLLELSSDNALLLLTTILGEIYTATTVFHPFEELATGDRNGQNPVKYLNPHLSLSLSNEASQAKRKLNRALNAWH